MRDLLPATVAVALAGPADWTGELLPAELSALGERAPVAGTVPVAGPPAGCAAGPVHPASSRTGT
ncbi:4-phosphopantetheinyl transferase, partial [Micromonospora aurantiaca]